MRISIPEGEVPAFYACTHIGSPVLRGSREHLQEARFLNDSTLTPRELEAPRFYGARLTDCNACSGWRVARDLPGYSGEPIEDAFYESILDYKTSPVYTVRESLMIEFCERFWFDHEGLSAADAFWKRLDANFTQIEIEDLTIMASIMDSARKINDVLLGVEANCAVPQSVEAESVV